MDTYVDAIGHDYKDAVVAPTCTEKGCTTHTCANCGNVIVDTYVDAIGHDYEDAVTAPTCTEKGYTTHTCANCGDVIGSVVAAAVLGLTGVIALPVLKKKFF